MKENDVNAVESMCMAGMSLEALYKIFKQFDKEDIRSVYERYVSTRDNYVAEDITIKTNCS
ncbi:MAG: hypothetical protein K6G69_06830 [Lachnospiraceae bacterium]|nr:hypothetical protein [Lachnospiraceae bacterium]